MSFIPRTYLVGRANSSIPCDIYVSAQESSVSRKHMELTVTEDGRYYVVHIHPRNTTKVFRDGQWISLTQDFVDLNAPLRLGSFETSVNQLLGTVLSNEGSAPEKSQSGSRGDYVWDEEAGTVVRRDN